MKKLTTCRIEPGPPANQSNTVLLYQWDSRYSRFFSHIYQKWIVIPVGQLGHVLDDWLSVG